MIDPLKETLFNVSTDAPKVLDEMGIRGRNGRRLHKSVLYRWIQDGLEVLRVGTRMHTSREAIVRYLQRRTAERDHKLALKSVSQASAEAAAAQERLQALFSSRRKRQQVKSK